MNSCGAQTMPQPPCNLLVCKWNGQHSTRQEVILVYAAQWGGFREIFLSIIFKWNSATIVFGVFFLSSQTSFRFELNLFLFFSWQWNCEAIHQGCQYPLSFAFYTVWANNRKQSAAASSSETDCCLVSLMCYLTNQAVKPALFPSSGTERRRAEEREQWRWVVAWHHLVK